VFGCARKQMYIRLIMYTHPYVETYYRSHVSFSHNNNITGLLDRAQTQLAASPGTSEEISSSPNLNPHQRAIPAPDWQVEKGRGEGMSPNTSMKMRVTNRGTTRLQRNEANDARLEVTPHGISRIRHGFGSVAVSGRSEGGRDTNEVGYHIHSKIVGDVQGEGSRVSKEEGGEKREQAAMDKVMKRLTQIPSLQDLNLPHAFLRLPTEKKIDNKPVVPNINTPESATSKSSNVPLLNFAHLTPLQLISSSTQAGNSGNDVETTQ